MKLKITLLTLFVTVFMTGFSQQIPNGSFETWTNSYTPAGWNGVENLLSTLFPINNNFFTYEDTTTYTQGRASVELVTDTITGLYSSIVGIQPGLITLGTAVLAPSGNSYAPAFTGLPFTYRPDSVIFDYMETSPGADSGGVQLQLTKNGVTVLSVATYLSPDSSWKHMAFALTGLYSNNEYPDTLQIQFVSSAINNPIVGTTLHVDGVRFGYVNQPLSVTASGTGVLCADDSVTLWANTGGSANYTYQWGAAGTPINGATNASYVAKQAGAYTVTIDSAGVIETSQQVAVNADNITASLTGLNDTLCSNAAAVTLHGTPAGGVYAGAGVTSSTFAPSAVLPGTDTVVYTVTDLNGCPKTASATVTVKVCTGIDNVDAPELTVYPNPASSLLNINCNQNLAGYSLKVYDVMGRVVISQTLAGNDNAISVALLATGTYIYRIVDKESGVISQNKFNVIK